MKAKKMNEKEFLAKIVFLEIQYSHKEKAKRDYYPDYWVHEKPKYNKGELNNPPTLEHFIYHEWLMATSSEWGGSGYHQTSFVELEAILENLCPKITYFQYKELTDAIIKKDDRHESGYYGESSVYGTNIIKLGDLFGKLKEMGLI